MVLLEEPETAIHPGLLNRLLEEIDAHSHERQIVLSTHSPALLNWAQPEDVRLVTRLNGKTEARRLTADELSRVGMYLDDDLGMADFVFSGALE